MVNTHTGSIASSAGGTSGNVATNPLSPVIDGKGIVYSKNGRTYHTPPLPPDPEVAEQEVEPPQVKGLTLMQTAAGISTGIILGFIVIYLLVRMFTSMSGPEKKETVSPCSCFLHL